MWASSIWSAQNKRLLLHTLAAYNYRYYNYRHHRCVVHWAGADPGDLLVTTSYDYDAPLSEAGDITPKYLAIRDLLSKVRGQPRAPLAGDTRSQWRHLAQ